MQRITGYLPLIIGLIATLCLEVAGEPISSGILQIMKSEVADPPTIFLRVMVTDPAPSKQSPVFVRATHIGGRPARAPRLEPPRVVPFADRPGGRTAWFPLPAQGPTVPYSGVTLYVGSQLGQRLSPDELTLDSIAMQVELAVAQTPDAIGEVRTLRPILACGNGVPFYFTAGDIEGVPQRAEWLIDHLQALHQGLLDGGFDSPVAIDPKVLRLGVLLDGSRFGAGDYGVLSRDPDMYRLYGDIFALAGYNIGTRGAMRELYDNHPHFHANMVEVAEGSQALAGDFLPSGLNIPLELDVTYRQSAEILRARGGLTSRWMKLGDEIGIPRWDETERARALLLQEAIIVTGDEPARLDLADWTDLAPVTETDPARVAPEDRLRYYITLRVRNIRAAERYAVETAAIHRHYGAKPLTLVNMLGPMYYGGYSACFWWRKTPDYFRMADIGAVDVLQIQGLNSAYPPGGPLILALLSPKVVAQAASRHPRVEPEIMHFACRTDPEAWPHVVFSSLISGVPNIDWYRFGPRASGWEWFDKLEKLLAHARLARKLERIAPYLSQPFSPLPTETAILWAESSDLWQRNPLSFSKSELRSTYFALRFAGIEADLLREYMVENGELGDYKLLFVAQRNVTRLVQQRILDWVRNGGTLVVTPGAMTRDAADQPCSILDDAIAPDIVRANAGDMPEASGEFAEFPVLDTVRWIPEADVAVDLPSVFQRQVVAGRAEPIVKFANDEVAARSMNLGAGAVIALGFFPGHAYTSGSARSVRETEVMDAGMDAANDNEVVSGIVRTGAPYWMEPDKNAARVFIDVADSAGVQPTIVTSAPTVDAGVQVNGNRAVVLLSNYTPSDVGDVQVQFSLPDRFANARAQTLDGADVALTWPNAREARCTVSVNDVQAVLIVCPPRGD
ncbi:MAG: hypothetical protein K9N49_01260 [Candidatus Marinimicrobia bacterium]|nr:hypothetical protein [Candidatus Neomarinimicrobiota bacterium]